MKCEAKTEQEMREYRVPTPSSYEELTEFIKDLIERDLDYGTAAYAMSLAATAAFNFVARQVGASGFQASCADLDILRRTRNLTGPFIIINGENELYPQYNLAADLQEARNGWVDWIGKEARKKLSTHKQDEVHANVWAHWERLAKLGVNNEQPED